MSVPSKRPLNGWHSWSGLCGKPRAHWFKDDRAACGRLRFYGTPFPEGQVDKRCDRCERRLLMLRSQ